MSLETWKAEFYPVPAADVPREQATQHSLTKWRGALPENLAKHGVGVDGCYVGDDKGSFAFDCFSCALCHTYTIRSGTCNECPLSIVRDDTACVFVRLHSDDPVSPYFEMATHSNPVPMIEWLEKALAYEQSQPK